MSLKTFAAIVSDQPEEFAPKDFPKNGLVGDFYQANLETGEFTHFNTMCGVSKFPGKVFSIRLESTGAISLTGDGELGNNLGSGQKEPGYRCEIPPVSKDGYAEVTPEVGQAIFAEKNFEKLRYGLANQMPATLQWLESKGLKASPYLTEAPKQAAATEGEDIPL